MSTSTVEMIKMPDGVSYHDIGEVELPIYDGGAYTRMELNPGLQLARWHDARLGDEQDFRDLAFTAEVVTGHHLEVKWGSYAKVRAHYWINGVEFRFSRVSRVKPHEWMFWVADDLLPVPPYQELPMRTTKEWLDLHKTIDKDYFDRVVKDMDTQPGWWSQRVNSGF